MKKILFIVFLFFISISTFAQSSEGWLPMRAKYNFRDSTNFRRPFMLNGILVSANAFELNLLDGLLSSTTELNYLVGTTGAIQSQFDLKAPITNPTFIGLIKLSTDTIATRAYVRSFGGGGGGIWGTIGGSLSNQTDLTSALGLKANISSPTFTGTVSGITSTMVGLGNVTNESKTTMFTVPTFTGGLAKLDADTLATRSYARAVGGGGGGGTAAIWGLITGTLGDQTDLITALNLKAALNSPTFTGTPIVPGYVPTSRTVNTLPLTGNINITPTLIGLGNVTNESKATMFTSPTFTGTPVIPSPFTLGGVSMTSSATELNILDGATLSTTELNYVHGVTGSIQGQLVDTVSLTDIALLKYVLINARTASYTLVLTDAAKVITMTVGSANTLTVPPNSSVAFPYGSTGATQITIVNSGTGQTTITAGSGVTINSAGGALKLRVQYSTCTLIKTGINTWLCIGDITV